MVSRFALLSNLFLVSVALAVPPPQLGARFPPGEDPQSQSLSRRVSLSARTPSDYEQSANWAGVFTNSSVNGTFNSVVATLAVPTILDDHGGFSMTIGLDGFGCTSALQAGIEVSITDRGPSYKAWYGWFPVYKNDFPIIHVHPGDVISVYVIATSATTGLVIMMNLSTSEIYSVTPTSSESYALCGRNAVWVIEDIIKDGTLTAFANFTTALFTNAIAAGPDYTSYGPSTGDTSVIVQNKTLLTSVNITANNILIQHL